MEDVMERIRAPTGGTPEGLNFPVGSPEGAREWANVRLNLMRDLMGVGPEVTLGVSMLEGWIAAGEVGGEARAKPC